MTQTDDMTLLHLFYQCSHLLHASGKYRGQGRLLVQLLKHGTLTQRELIQMTGRRSATLSEQLDNMEKAGYITRSRNETDRRNVDVSLTPLGQETAADAQRCHAERARRLFSVLNEEEKDQLSGLLQKLQISWKELPPESEAILK